MWCGADRPHWPSPAVVRVSPCNVLLSPSSLSFDPFSLPPHDAAIFYEPDLWHHPNVHPNVRPAVRASARCVTFTGKPKCNQSVQVQGRRMARLVAANHPETWAIEAWVARQDLVGCRSSVPGWRHGRHADGSELALGLPSLAPPTRLQACSPLPLHGCTPSARPSLAQRQGTSREPVLWLCASPGRSGVPRRNTVDVDNPWQQHRAHREQAGEERLKRAGGTPDGRPCFRGPGCQRSKR